MRITQPPARVLKKHYKTLRPCIDAFDDPKVDKEMLVFVAVYYIALAIYLSKARADKP